VAEQQPVEHAEPPVPSARIQRQDDGGDGQPPARQALPLRESPTPPAPSAPGGPALAQALGDQVYARMVQGANLPRVNMTATGTRRGVQRQPSAGPEPLLLAEARGMSRSSPAQTPVLPQARIQRDFEPVGALDFTDTAMRPSAPQTSGVLPLAPPAVASARGARKAGITTTGVQSLPLAPTIQRHDEPDSDTTTTTTTRPRSNAISSNNYRPEVDNDDDDGDMGLVRLFSEDELDDDLDPDTPDVLDTSVSDDINLDELADKLLPYLKRLMKIERERYSPT
jgi:hypothetical protein